MSLWFKLMEREWFKLRGRRVMWALLGVLLVFSSVIVLIRFGDYQFQKGRDVVDEVIFLPGSPEIDNFEVKINCTEFLASGALPGIPDPYTLDDVDGDRTGVECRKEVGEVNARLEVLVDEFTLPNSIPKALRWTQLIAIPFVAFLTVLVVGSEYGWGTLRTMLMRGPGRPQVLSVKLALVAALLLSMWILLLLTIIATSLISTAFVSDVGHGDWTAGVTGDVIRDLGRAWYSGIPYVALAAFLSVLFSSWAGGTLAAAALSVGYFFFELFSIGRLIKLFDGVAAFRWFGTAIEYDLGWNTAAWMFGRAGEPLPGFALAGAIGSAEYPGDVHSFVVQLVYVVIILGVTFWLFQRRDVAGPSG